MVAKNSSILLLFVFSLFSGTNVTRKNAEIKPLSGIDLFYNNLFVKNNGWNGGDGAYSILLPDKRIIWLFGDSFFGKVDKERIRDGNKNVMVRNAVLVQKNIKSQTFVSLNTGKHKNTQTFFKVANCAENENWYWPLDATLNNNSVQVALMRMKKNGEGMWGFAATGVDIGILSLPALKLEKIVTQKYMGEIGYGSSLCENSDGFTYLYGTSRSGMLTNLHVARVPKGDLTSEWQFWNGKNWQKEHDIFSIHKNVSSMFSVWKENEEFYLLTQEPNFGRKIFLFNSANPVGPFINKKLLYEVPEGHGSGKMFSYNAIYHPELSDSGEFVISYSKNPHNFFDNFHSKGSADLYLPVFIRVPKKKN